MAFPTVVDAGGTMRFPWLPNGRPGPFVLPSTKLAGILTVADIGSLHAWVSTDGGNTWAESDAAHAPTLGLIGVSDAAAVGEVVYVAHLSAAWPDTPYVTVTPFDASTGLWGPPVISAYELTLVSAHSSGPKSYSFVEARSDGSILAVYHSLRGGGAETSRIAVFSDDAWVSGDTQIGLNTGGAEWPAATLLGAEDRVHVFILEQLGHFYHQTVKSDGTLGTVSQPATDIFMPANGRPFNESVGTPVYNSVTGEIAVPFKNADGHTAIATATSVDDPTWSAEIIDAMVDLYATPYADNGTQLLSAIYDPAGNLVVFGLDGSQAVHAWKRTAGVWAEVSWPTTMASVGFPALASDGKARMFFSGPDDPWPVSYYEEGAAPRPRGLYIGI